MLAHRPGMTAHQSQKTKPAVIGDGGLRFSAHNQFCRS
jgi:hypothetical protein